MSRNETENFSQDRLGNSNRELDSIRGQDGMEEDANTPSGLIEVTTGDDDGATDLTVLELPDDAEGFHLEELHAHNGTGAAENFSVFSATLADDGTVDTTTRRSVPMNVAAGVTRTISYSGKEFNEDAIVVTSNFTGYIGVGGYMDIPEYRGSAYEQTEAP